MRQQGNNAKDTGTGDLELLHACLILFVRANISQDRVCEQNTRQTDEGQTETDTGHTDEQDNATV